MQNVPAQPSSRRRIINNFDRSPSLSGMQRTYRGPVSNPSTQTPVPSQGNLRLRGNPKPSLTMIREGRKQLQQYMQNARNHDVKQRQGEINEICHEDNDEGKNLR